MCASHSFLSEWGRKQFTAALGHDIPFFLSRFFDERATYNYRHLWMVHWFRTSSVKSLAVMPTVCTVRTDEVYSQRENGSAWLCLRKASPCNTRNYLKCCKVSVPSVYGWRIWLLSFSKQHQQHNGTRFIVRYATDYLCYMYLLFPDNYRPEEYISLESFFEY